MQGFVVHRMRRGPVESAVEQARRRVCVVHPVDDDVLDRASTSWPRAPSGDATPSPRGRPAATALVHGFDHIGTCDADVARIDGLRVFDPVDV